MEEIRLQKYLADCGVASRRKCEEMIIAGRVKVDGETIIQLGTKVSGSEKITVDGQAVAFSSKKKYILLNKPSGYITTAQDDYGRPTVFDLIKGEIHQRVFPVGRLDYDTEGLLIMTNDGDMTYTLTHPKHSVDKTYIAHLAHVPRPVDIDKLKRGVMIDGRKTAPANVDWLKDNILKITIREGRNRQIRKMIEAVGNEVEYLQRISIGNIVLGNVPLGRWRHLSPGEIDYLKRL